MSIIQKIPAILLIFTLSVSYAQDDSKVPIMEILYSVVQKEGAKEAVSKYYELKRTDRELYDFSFGQLNRLGMRLSSEGKVKDAIEIFRLNLKIYPDKVTAHNSLADALVKDNRKDIAVNYYKQGLEKLKEIEEIDPAIFSSYEEYGNRQIKILTELNQSENADLTYWANVGGVPAGNWDVDQILDFKFSQPELSVNYRVRNFYNSPVPEFVIDELDTGGQPDVITGYVNGYYREAIQNKAIKELSALWEKENYDEYFEPYLKKAVSYEENIYFIPLTYQWNPIWYRKDLFDSLDISVPTTWEELLTVCKTLKKSGIQPFTVSGEGWQPPLARWFSILTLRIHGHGFYEELMKGNIAWTDAKVAQVFDQWKILFDQQALDTASASNNWTDAVAELASGKAAMWNIGEWLFEFKPIQEQKDNLGFFPMPTINPELETTEILHLYGAHIMNKPVVNGAADQWIHALAQPELQKSNHDKLKYRIPANSGAQGQLTALQTQMRDYLKTVDNFVPLFEFNTHPEIAKLAMEEFLYFWKYPDEAKSVMENLEKKRKEVYPSK